LITVDRDIAAFCRARSPYQWRHHANIGTTTAAATKDNETISRVDRSSQSNLLRRTHDLWSSSGAGGRTSQCPGRDTSRQMQATDSGSIKFSAHPDRRLRGHAAPPGRRVRVTRPLLASPGAVLLCLIIRPARPQNY